MDNLVARLGAPPKPHANKCSVGQMLKDMLEGDRDAVQNALEMVRESIKSGKGLTNGYTATWLAGILKDEGYKVSERMIRRHIHGDCSCESR